jgi:hypothetical protein
MKMEIYIWISAKQYHSNTMTIEKFNLLNLPQQHYYTIKCAVFLSARHEKAYSVYLFQLPAFYVEVFYKHGEMECSVCKSFENSVHLEPYLSSISIDGLLA